MARVLLVDNNRRIPNVSAVAASWRRVRALLPSGQLLSEADWARRHRFIAGLVWLHVPALFAFALLRGYPVGHALVDAGIVAVPAAAGTWIFRARAARTVAATLGLLSSSAILVHLSGGLVEMHFHFFVMVVVVTLYESWLPFLLAIGYVVVHHGLLGTLDPAGVYNHSAAIRSPWRWAAVHGGFILAESLAAMAFWRMNETSRREIRTSAERYRLLFDGNPLPMWVFDSSTLRFLAVNDAAVGGYGYSREEFLGMTIADIRPPEDVVALVRDLNRIRGEHVRPGVWRHRKKDGTLIDVEVSGHSVEWNGRPARLILALDVTAKRQAEQALRQNERRYAEAYEREREVADRLRNLDEMKNGFLSAVSHELRTPLTVVLGFALTLRDLGPDIPREAFREMMDRLASNAQKLERLLSDLLDIDRLSRGVIELRREPTDIGRLVANVVAEVDANGHPLSVDAGPLVVSADRPKVERIVENLVANAVKHTPPGTPITVVVRRVAAGAEIAVEDRGEGVPAEIREQIFEPFRQGPSRQQHHHPGTGIGLSLVARFAELHGGRAWVDERAGGGAVFRVLLPGAHADAAATESPTPAVVAG